MRHARRLLRLWPRLALAGGAGLAAVLLALWLLHNRPVELPRPTGPYAVGRVELDWTDRGRLDPFAQPPGPRTLPVWIWYPADSPPAPISAPYLPPAWLAAREDGFNPLALLLHNPAHIRGHALAGVGISRRAPRYPLLIMQPGLGPALPDYTALAEELASQGYIVAGSTPPYSANVAAFADGHVVRGVAAATIPDGASAAVADATLGRLVEVWAADDRFMLDRLAELSAADPAGLLTGRIDLDAVGVLGHSFGGAAAAETCRVDGRCGAAVDLDGYLYGGAAVEALRRPLLVLWSEPVDPRDPAWLAAAQHAQAAIRGSPASLALTIVGMRHFNVSDFAVVFAPTFRPMQLLGPIDGTRGLRIAGAYVTAFFDRALRHRPSTLLDGPSAAYPEVRFAAPER